MLTIPEEVIRSFQEIIDANDLEYTDNFRYALFSDKASMREFEKKHNSGCCSTFEYDVKDNDGRRWLCGCNYGH